MFIFQKIKQRIYAYTDYISAENRFKHIFDIESSRLRHDVLFKTDSGIEDERYCDGKNVIVSLTTYGKRLYDVYLTIESIMQQTQKANKIVLWLADNMKDVKIPLTLQRQQKRGLEIRYCKDIRSYKKLIPSLKAFPDDIIITVDDDVIYGIDLLELLLNSYNQNKEMVHCGWAKKIDLHKTYKEWENATGDSSYGFEYMPIGSAGVLYPPHILDTEVFNETVFMDSCKYADDIWFKAMAMKANHQCQFIETGLHEHLSIDNPLWQDKGLTLINEKKRENDVQLQDVFNKYHLAELLSN